MKDFLIINFFENDNSILLKMLIETLPLNIQEFKNLPNIYIEMKWISFIKPKRFLRSKILLVIFILILILILIAFYLSTKHKYLEGATGGKKKFDARIAKSKSSGAAGSTQRTIAAMSGPISPGSVQLADDPWKLTKIDIERDDVDPGTKWDKKKNIYKNRYGTGSVKIPDGVTKIGDWKFDYCLITSIDLPKTLLSIGKHSLSVCAIKNITLPDAVTTIGEHAFTLSNIESIVIPKLVTIINPWTFSGCKFLTTVTLNNVTRIENSAFESAPKLTTINMPKVTVIGNRAFYECDKLKNIDLSNVTSIGDYAFYNCGDTRMIQQKIGKTVKIGTEAFGNGERIEPPKGQ